MQVSGEPIKNSELDRFQKGFIKYINYLKKQGLDYNQIKDVMLSSLKKDINYQATKLMNKDLSQSAIAEKLKISVSMLTKSIELEAKKTA